jgi:hypothetical protein
MPKTLQEMTELLNDVVKAAGEVKKNEKGRIEESEETLASLLDSLKIFQKHWYELSELQDFVTINRIREQFMSNANTLRQAGLGHNKTGKKFEIWQAAETIIDPVKDGAKRAELQEKAKEEARRRQEEEEDRLRLEALILEQERQKEISPVVSLNPLTKESETPAEQSPLAVSMQTVTECLTKQKAGPRVDMLTEDLESLSQSGYYPYLKAQESRAYKNPSIKIEIPDITPEEFAALKQELISIVKTYKQPITEVPAGMERPTTDSYYKVYKNSSVHDSGDNSFAFQINDKSAFDVQLEKDGISITFSDKGPQAQSIAAAAGMMHDIVDTYNQKKEGSRVKALVIKDYESDLITGMAIFCSLACQKKPVEFDNYEKAFAKSPGERVVADLLQELAKTPEGRDRLLNLVDDGHGQLKDIVAYAHSSKCSKEDLAKHFGLPFTVTPEKPSPESDSTSSTTPKSTPKPPAKP